MIGIITNVVCVFVGGLVGALLANRINQRTIGK